jgi:hypothetical protein
MSKSERTEVYLEADKEIPGQHYVCISFISPNKVIKEKAHFFFSEFLKDYAIQYKIKATESFLMSQATKLQSALTGAQDVLENLALKAAGATVTDLSGALSAIKDARIAITRDVAADLEAHVKAEMSDFRENTLTEAYETFLFKNKKRLEEAYFEKNEFQTTVQGVKVRGVYDTYGEAVARAKQLQKLDPSFNIYVGQVGFWLPWDPEPHEVADQEYADEQLNQLMKKYKENETTRDELYAQHKLDRMGGAAPPRGVTAGSGGVGAGAGAGAGATAASMFDGEDLAIARKREAAARISHA